MVRVAITGAAGQIAYQLIFSVLKGEVFGEKKIALTLIDINQEKLQGVLMEVEDCHFPHLESIAIYTDQELDKGFKDIDFAFLVGASPRTEGMERADLLTRNGEIFKTQGKALSQYAKQSVQVLVVGNPCNTNCLVAMHHAKNIPHENFYAMTMLDEHRATYQANKYLGISDAKVYIYGNHSATQYPDFENMGMEAQGDWWINTFVPMIQTRGAEVIKKRGASSAASAAHAAITTARCLTEKTTKPFSVARVSNGEYGSPKGLIVSLPYCYQDGQLVVKSGFSHSERAKAMMQASFSELQEEYDQVKEMGLLDD